MEVDAAMTDIDHVWTRLEGRAASFAERKAMLSVSDARMIVIETYREQRAGRPPAEGLESLAAKLVRLAGRQES
jgi:hypothetical protein